MDLLFAIDGDKSHYVYIKDFDRFMFHKTRNKNKKYFCKICLSINGEPSVRLEKGTIEFKKPVPFKIYFECNLKSVESYEVSYSKKYQDLVPCSFAYKLVCVNDKFTKPKVAFRGENVAYKFIEAIL